MTSFPETPRLIAGLPEPSYLAHAGAAAKAAWQQGEAFEALLLETLFGELFDVGGFGEGEGQGAPEPLVGAFAGTAFGDPFLKEGPLGLANRWTREVAEEAPVGSHRAGGSGVG